MFHFIRKITKCQNYIHIYSICKKSANIYICTKCIYNDSTGEKKIAWILKLSINRSISIICNWILRNCGFTRVYLSIRQFVACIWRLSHALQFTLHMFIWRDVTRHYNIIAIWWTHIVVLDWTHDGGWWSWSWLIMECCLAWILEYKKSF